MHATDPTTPAEPAPLTDRVTVLTERGHAALAFFRWLDQVRDLEASDQAAVIALVVAELEPTPAA